MTDASTVDLAAYYLAGCNRVSTLARAEADRVADTAVPACPGWSAKDVIAHVSGIAEDALAGKLSGIPDDETTAEQVASRRDRTLDDLLAGWEASAPAFATTVADLGIWPAVMDVLTHEQDLRGALDRPGARDAPGVIEGLRVMAGGLRVPLRLTITTEDQRWERGPRDADTISLATTNFELFRVLFGRRSREQILALDWSADPGDLVDHLYFFGPAPGPIVEPTSAPGAP
jgi:uncharacterized protein (TIGR03083 family)